MADEPVGVLTSSAVEVDTVVPNSPLMTCEPTPTELVIIRRVSCTGLRTVFAASSNATLDSLHELSSEERNVLWANRYYLRNSPHVLPKVLQAVDWTNPTSVTEGLRYSAPLPPIDLPL